MFDTFDFAEMATLALGPYWERLMKQQRTEFVSLFGNLFKQSYNRLVLRFLPEREAMYGTQSTIQERAIVHTTLVD